MAPQKTKKIIASLEKKGFAVSQSDHVMLILHVGDKKTSIRTKISHGSKEYDDRLLNLVKKELKLENREQLDRLIECPMSQEEYVAILVRNNHIRVPLAPEIAIPRK